MEQRNFTVVEYTRNSIVFKIVDPDGKEGFPGEVTAYITYWLSPNKWHFAMNATTTKLTPVMLTSHVYWNLDGFQNPATNQALNHTLYMPFAGQTVDVDGILIPTGKFNDAKPGSINDFWSKPKQIGASFADPALPGSCGTNCTGYDNCWIVERGQFGPDYFKNKGGKAWWSKEPVTSLWSDFSNIQVDIYSDQDAFQMYSCNGQNGKFRTASARMDNY